MQYLFIMKSDPYLDAAKKMTAILSKTKNRGRSLSSTRIWTAAASSISSRIWAAAT
jgi:subtilisin-like proprotein convertase family protein